MPGITANALIPLIGAPYLAARSLHASSRIPLERQITDMRITLYLLLTTLLWLPLNGLAGSFAAHDLIRATAREHALAQARGFAGRVEVTAGKLDRRLRLAACDKPLTGYNSPNGLKPGRNVVGVRCDGAKPWKIYVTVNVATMQTVVVAAHPVARGQLLGRTDLRIEERDTGRIRKAYYTDPASLIGQRARRAIATGRVLDPGMLEQRQLVKKGATVQIVASQGALQVRMKGKALDNGAQGERIRARNLGSGREITGEVVASGVIRVTP